MSLLFDFDGVKEGKIYNSLYVTNFRDCSLPSLFENG